MSLSETQILRLLFKKTALSLLFVLCSCGSKKESAPQEEAQAEKTSIIQISREQFIKNEMQLGKAEQREFPLLVHASGMIDVPPEKRVVISAPVGGYIKSIRLLVGDKVRKGNSHY